MSNNEKNILVYCSGHPEVQDLAKLCSRPFIARLTTIHRIVYVHKTKSEWLVTSVSNLLNKYVCALFIA